MMQTTGTQREWYLAHFEQFEKSLNGESRSAIHDLRRQALAEFKASGFPTVHDEEWRFTNISPITLTPFEHGKKQSPVRASDIQRLLLPDAGVTLVFVDGRYSPELSSAKETQGEAGSLATQIQNNPALVIQQLSESPRVDGNPFVALGTAFLHDGAYIHVPDHTDVARPMHILYVSSAVGSPYAVYPRNLILVGKNASVSILETYVCLNAGVYFNNTVTDVAVGEDSRVEMTRVQDEGAAAFHVGTVAIRQQRGSRFTATTVSFGGAIVRNTMNAVLDGEGGECTLNGMSLATGQQLIDNHTTIDHARPHCASHELYKSILADKARGVFNGKIFVRKDAQKTDAKQTNKTLLLSDEATIDTKPQLEIFADDVKCTHGATVGQLDEEQLFYLRSRGLDLSDARDLLINAFAGDVLGRISLPVLREQLLELLRERLRQQSQTSRTVS